MMIKKDFNDLNSLEEFTRQHRLLLIDFYADWCEPCKMLDEILAALEKDLPSGVVICKIDIDKNPALQKHYSIMSVPTLMIFKEGIMEWRMPGFELAQDLKKRLAAFLV